MFQSLHVYRNILKIYLNEKLDFYHFSVVRSVYNIRKSGLLEIYVNLMAPFYGWGSGALNLESLRWCSLLFTEIPGTHFVDLGRMKGWVNLGSTQWFWTGDP